MWAELNEESIVRANAQFWEQMLGMQLERVPRSQEFCVGAQHFVGSVDLSGAWSGRIEIRLDKGLAIAATSAMLMAPADGVAEADILDAIREIVNMIGGVVKSSLPRPCVMTIPESSAAAEPLRLNPRTECAIAIAFRHESGEIIVRVWEEGCTDY
jgi:chemotaxis protein CheX